VINAPYRSGPSKVWLKPNNPASAAVRRKCDSRAAQYRRKAMGSVELRPATSMLDRLDAIPHLAAVERQR
jgi:hypothetical protein